VRKAYSTAQDRVIASKDKQRLRWIKRIGDFLKKQCVRGPIKISLNIIRNAQFGTDVVTHKEFNCLRNFVSEDEWHAQHAAIGRTYSSRPLVDEVIADVSFPKTERN
jgi:hypothetical protein